MSLKWKLGSSLSYLLVRTLFRFRVSGQANLLKDRGQILVANHVSNIDPLLVGVAAGQEIYFMAKEELFKFSKFFSRLIASYNAIPLARNERATEALKKCANLLKKNCSILIFPEGSRNKFKTLQSFKPGAGFLSITNQVPIIPVAVAGVCSTWHGRFTRLIDRDIRKNYIPDKTENKFVTVKFGKAIYPSGYQNARDDYEKLTETVKQTITEMLKENEG